MGNCVSEKFIKFSFGREAAKKSSPGRRGYNRDGVQCGGGMVLDMLVSFVQLCIRATFNFEYLDLIPLKSWAKCSVRNVLNLSPLP